MPVLAEFVRSEKSGTGNSRCTARSVSFPVGRVRGVGTTGTLMGCARWFWQWRRRVRVVAVDSVGSVTFGDPPTRRMIPGLGTSVPPPLLDPSYVDDVVRVEEPNTVRTCRRLAGRGFLFGGSTGTVVSGAAQWLSHHGCPGLTAVAIAPALSRLGSPGAAASRVRAVMTAPVAGRFRAWQAVRTP